MRRGRIRFRAAALIVLSAAALGIGIGIAIHQLEPGRGSSSQGNPPGLHGQATWGPGARTAPGFVLRDQAGRAVSLASLRGSNVMLAFLSTRCRRACAREARSLGMALRLLRSSERPTLIVVSVDPRHDTPGSARDATTRWGLAAASWHWLLGSEAQLAPVWSSYRVEVPRADGTVDGKTPVYLIDRDGFERAGLLFPFPPTWPAADFRILTREG
jgi:protein SCO1